MLDKTPTAPTTTDEQIAFLRSRGLCIPDEEHAKSFLLRNNYYRIKGYTLTLCHDGVFNEDASFQDVEDIYSFDLELRHLLLKYLEIIETTIKSVYAYEFTRIYGPVGYLDPNNFLDANEYNTIMKKAKKQRDSRIAHEAYPVHFENDWQGVPIWVFVDFLTISDISFLYKISQQQIKCTVAESMNLRTQGSALLEKFMHSMTIVRNLCAHGSRLYDCVFGQKPKLSKKEMALLMKNADGTACNARLYGFVIIMKRLLASEQFAMLKEQLAALSAKSPCVNPCKHWNITASGTTGKRNFSCATANDTHSAMSRLPAKAACISLLPLCADLAVQPKMRLMRRSGAVSFHERDPFSRSSSCLASVLFCWHIDSICKKHCAAPVIFTKR